MDISRLALKSIGLHCTLNIERSITNKDGGQLSTYPQILKIANCINVGDLMSEIDGHYLEELYIGKDVEGFPKDISKFSKLTIFRVGDTVPPLCPIATSDQYQALVVIVPAGTINLYKNTEGWKNFFNLIEEDSDALADLEADDSEYILFNLQGRPVNEHYRGLVIKRSSSGKIVKTFRK